MPETEVTEFSVNIPVIQQGCISDFCISVMNDQDEETYGGRDLFDFWFQRVTVHDVKLTQ